MNCDRCHKAIAPGEEERFHGQALCEDCYMDAFSPTRTCDPWAVRSAMHCKDSDGGGGPTPEQEKILAILRETGGAGIDLLSARLGGKAADIQRDLAALRHMEKVRGALRDGEKIFRPW